MTALDTAIQSARRAVEAMRPKFEIALADPTRGGGWLTVWLPSHGVVVEVPVAECDTAENVAASILAAMDEVSR